MKRYRLPITIGLAAVLAIAGIGAALAAWCWSDPVVGIQAPGKPERDLNIDVAVPDENRGDILGDVEIEVVTPSNVAARVKFMDNVLPERVSFLTTSSSLSPDAKAVPVGVVVRVNSAVSFPVQVKVSYIGDDGKLKTEIIKGVSNQALSHDAKLKP